VPTYLEVERLVRDAGILIANNLGLTIKHGDLMNFYKSIIFVVALTGCDATGSPETDAQVSRVERCKPTSTREISALFDRWNLALQTGEPKKVGANYAERSILIPTLSNKLRLTAASKEEYFWEFMKDGPSGKIDFRHIEIGCNWAVDAGLYTFHFMSGKSNVKARYMFVYRWDQGKWLITAHHSSAMPEHM